MASIPSELATGGPPVRLEIRDLKVHYRTGRGRVRAVDGIDLTIEPGQNLGLVGESGCGKSTVIKAVLRLLPDGTEVTGSVRVDEDEILTLPAEELRKLRWTKLALITQSAMNALDPVFRVGDQISESIEAHFDLPKETLRKRGEELFHLVGIAPERLDDYPHQFSGGMRQRAVIAMALSLNAGLLLADEPTTALDPIMQDQVLGRIQRIQDELSRSMLLVTHDMAVVAETCESIAVMYAGKVVELGPTQAVLGEPGHPYTMGLRNAFPSMTDTLTSLISIPGTLPDLIDPPGGCLFSARCPFATELCVHEEPPLVDVGDGHRAACHYVDRAAAMRAEARTTEAWERVATRWESEEKAI